MKMKKLLASALAAALVVSSMVGTIVTSAATKVGTITAATVNALAGQTDTVEAEVNITFDKGVVAPHNFITVALAGYELTDVALGDVAYATDAQGKVSIDKEYCDLDAGKILIEAPVDATAPTVTAITLTVTFADVDDVDTVAGEYDIVVNADDMSDVDEADLTLDAVNGKLIVTAPHVHDFVPTVTDPTCTDAGYTTYNCACGEDSYVDDEVPALGHNYDDEVTTAPDCDDAGVKTYTCSRCQHSYTEAIDPLGHKPVEIPAADATCTTDGATAGVKCDVCDAIITAPTTIPATGHTAGEPVEENRVEAKPGVAGSYDSVVYCTVCKVEISRTTNEIPALPVEPDCDHADATFVSANPATETKLGSITFDCPDCGEVTVDVEYNAYNTVATFSAACESEIQLQYDVWTSLFKAGSDISTTMFVIDRVDYSGNEPTTVTKVLYPEDAVEFTSQGKPAYRWSYGVAAMMLNDTCSATVYCQADGVWYSGIVYVKSFAEYAIANLKGTDPEMDTLFVDLLNYGAAAQVQFGYNEGNLANSTLTEEQKALATAEDPAATEITNLDYTLAAGHYIPAAYSLMCESRIQIRYSFMAYGFTADPSNVRLDFTYVDYKGVEHTSSYAYYDTLLAEGNEEKIAAGEYFTLGADGRIYVDFAKLTAADGESVVVAKLYVGDSVEADVTVDYSVASYVAVARDKAYADLALTNALYKYCKSANVKFA